MYWREFVACIQHHILSATMFRDSAKGPLGKAEMRRPKTEGKNIFHILTHFRPIFVFHDLKQFFKASKTHFEQKFEEKSVFERNSQFKTQP